MQVCRHFIWPDAITVFRRFLHRIGAEADNFTFDHHIEAVTIRQCVGHFNIEIIFSDF